MDRLLQSFFCICLLLAGKPAVAVQSIQLSPTMGIVSSSSDKEGKYSFAFLRADLDYFPEKEYGLGLFFAHHANFFFSPSTSLTGFGVSATRRWQPNKYLQPYIRAELYSWETYEEQIRTDSGYSPGLTMGFHLSVRSLFTGTFIKHKIEARRYFDINGIDIEQIGVGTAYEW